MGVGEAVAARGGSAAILGGEGRELTRDCDGSKRSSRSSAGEVIERKVKAKEQRRTWKSEMTVGFV